MILRWRREFDQYQDGSFSGHGNANMTSEQKEIVKLKKELRDAKIKRDILKKAISMPVCPLGLRDIKIVINVAIIIVINGMREGGLGGDS